MTEGRPAAWWLQAWSRPRLSGAVVVGACCLLALSLTSPARVPGADDQEALAAGTLLIAARKLADPNFARTAVVLLDHGEEGAVGLIINRPSDVSLAHLMPALPGVSRSTARVFRGGPLGPSRLLLLIREARQLPGARPVVPGLQMSGEMDTLEYLLSAQADGLNWRAFVGYAGWGPGQLEAEIGRGDWILTGADAEMVFDADPESLWPTLMKRHEGTWVDRFPTGARGAPGEQVTMR